jgi:hypothetical protein
MNGLLKTIGLLAFGFNLAAGSAVAQPDTTSQEARLAHIEYQLWSSYNWYYERDEQR